MKRGATREEIIRTTQELIARNGIRAVRVDEIAQMLGISKRTLYELFADKNDLVNTCLDAMNRQQQQRIAACRRRRAGNPLQRAFRLANEYLDNLYDVDHTFLSDIRRREAFAGHYDDHWSFWCKELARAFEACREEHYLLPEVDSQAFANRLMSTLLELRLGGSKREELYFFCRTILRGAATKQGIDLIDRNT